jgi:glutamate racemase
MQNKLPIGVFDSGVGGLTVLNHIRNILPNEDLIYVADRQHVPYGSKGDSFTRDRTNSIANFLIELPVKALVVACNTATAAAIHHLRNHLTLPIIGMEPGVKPAATQSRNGKIGILATEGTLDSSKFKILLERHANNAELFIKPCHGWVESIEGGSISETATLEMIRKTLDPILNKEIDTLVLGCTHYPFLMERIKQVTGDEINIIDTGLAVAQQLHRRLEKEGLLNPSQAKGSESFWCSGSLDEMRLLLSRLWGSENRVNPLPE